MTSKILLIFKPQTTNFKIWNISRTENDKILEAILHADHLRKSQEIRPLKIFVITLFNDEVFSIFLLPFSMGFEFSFGKKKVVIFCSS